MNSRFINLKPSVLKINYIKHLKMSLFDAIHKHDVEECERLAKLQADNEEGKYRMKNYMLNPLGLALLYKYDDIVILLRKYGYNTLGADAIDTFVENDMIALVRLYFEKCNENPNFVNEKGKSLLHIAIEQENVKIVKLLLKNGANPNIKEVVNDYTPLQQAIQANKPNSKIIKLLLKYGANPVESAYNEQGEIFNPFQLAIKRQKHEAIDLIAKGIKKQKQKEYLLILASREYDAGSLLHRDYLPKDMFVIIFSHAWEIFHFKYRKTYLKN